MFNKDFMRFERLKKELERIQNLCPEQYFAVDKCPGPVGNIKCKNQRYHVDRFLYPCIHYFTGNCKYGMHCHFSHHIRRQIIRPQPKKQTCKKLYYQNICPAGKNCKFSHDLKQYPCYYNTVGKCKFGDEFCNYSHTKLVEAPVVCFFSLMKDGCKNSPEDCRNSHVNDPTKYLSYDGPI